MYGRTPQLPELTSLPQHRGAASTWRLMAAVVCTACATAGLTSLLLARTPASPPAAHPTPPPQASSSARPAATAGTAGPRTSGVYRLLPVTARQLTAATATGAVFTRLYATYSYTEPASAYLARLQPYTAPVLQTALADAATTPGLRQLRDEQHASATCTVTVTAISDIASTAITVLVTARQHTRTRATARTTVHDYAITLTPDGTTWQVYDIEPATAGQAGNTP